MEGSPQTSGEIKAWQNALIHWFRENGRDYPWRRTTDPYEILVSELMLQQTRIGTVLERRFFENWLEKFPDVHALAKADVEKVLKAWEGLGYYNRARNLQKAAIYIVEELDGIFPVTLEGVRILPGVGPYTAGAVCSFAFNLATPIVDGNVIRVLSRVFRFQDPVDSSSAQKMLWAKAGELTPSKNSREYNSAIMELGQQICGKGNPRCIKCPVSRWCLSKDDPGAGLLPLKAKTVVITRKTEEVVLLIQGDQVFLSRETGSRRTGLWRLPHLENIEPGELEQIGRITYPITRYIVEMTVFGTPDQKIIKEITKKTTGQWFDLREDLPALGSPYLRAIEEEMARKENNL